MLDFPTFVVVIVVAFIIAFLVVSNYGLMTWIWIVSLLPAIRILGLIVVCIICTPFRLFYLHHRSVKRHRTMIGKPAPAV